MMARYGGIGYGGNYGGLSSTKPTQTSESDITNLGGTAPGGVTAFIGGAAQWSTGKGASEKNMPPGSVVHAAMNMHVGLPDEAPDGSRNVPIHPGIQPGKFRTASDANPIAPDGKTAVANDGRPISPDGRHRGESPEVPKQPRGPYMNT